MKQLTHIVLLLLTLMSATSKADHCSSWGCLSTIETLYTNANGNIYVGTTQDEALANCTPVIGTLFTLENTSENTAHIYSTILAAYLSNTKVKIRIAESSANCRIAYVEINKTLQ